VSLADIPEFIRHHYEIHEWRHASAVLAKDFPQEWNDIMGVLTNFRLYKSHIAVGGGRKSEVADSIDHAFSALGWREKQFDTRIVVDRNELHSPTHQVDEYKNKIAVEVEWNNKDPFFDRDLNNFRLLFELRVISAGIIIIRRKDGKLRKLQNHKQFGYKVISFHLGKGKNCRKYVHRLVLSAFRPTDNPDLVTNHKDCDPSNNDIDNLEWITQKENVRHSMRMGRYNNFFTKEARKRSKEATSKKVIRSDGRIYSSISAAARNIGVPKQSVWGVCHGKTKQSRGYSFRILYKSL
jgi:hypothetical protein